MWIKPRLNVIKQTSKQQAKILVCKDTFKKDSKNTRPSFREESFSDVCFLFFCLCKKNPTKIGFSQFASAKWKFTSAKWYLSRQNDFSFLSSFVVFILFIYKKNMIVQCLYFHISNSTFLSLCNTYDPFRAKTSSIIFGKKLEDRSLSRRTKTL